MKLIVMKTQKKRSLASWIQNLSNYTFNNGHTNSHYNNMLFGSAHTRAKQYKQNKQRQSQQQSQQQQQQQLTNADIS